MNGNSGNKWIVSKNLKLLLWVTLILSMFMFANTIYLFIIRIADEISLNFLEIGNTTIPKLFQWMVLSHTGAGLLLVTLMLIFGIAHLPKVWVMYKHRTGLSGIGFVITGFLLVGSGFFILTSSASRDNNWVWWVHVICALLAPTGYIIHRLGSQFNKPGHQGFKKFSYAVLGIFLFLIVGHALTNRGIILTEEAKLSIENGLNIGPGAKNRDVSKFLNENFVPEGFVPPGSPFFPAATTTTSGGYLPSRIITRGDLGKKDEIEKEIDQNGFVKNALIGATTCERCHQDIVEQWSSSAHRFASFNNPFYEATINDLRSNSIQSNKWIEQHLEKFEDFENNGVALAKSKWCSGCHDPALMLAGKMNRPINRIMPEAQAGLTCLACHSIDKIHNLTGNGNYNIADEQEDPYLFAMSKEGTVGAFLHDAALKAKPNVHMQQMLKPFFKESEYCMTCHKVSLSDPVNNYRWLRGQDEYDNWHDSGISLNASRTFYLPPFKRECQDCHMPPELAPLGDLAAKNGTVKSHRFIAANTALPFIRKDSATIQKIVQFLQNDKLSVDIFALSISGQDEINMAIDHSNLLLPADKEVIIDVVVRNKGVGHTFPGGTNDSNEGWLEFSLKNEKGELMAISGFLDEGKHLDKMAHTFKAVLVDKDSNPISKRNAQDIHTTVYANVIGPGTADIAHYSLKLPKELEGEKLTMKARLLWRKFDRKYTEFAYDNNRVGFKQFSQVPDLPITEIAGDEITFTVTSARSNNISSPEIFNKISPEEWIRFNDYGIGLLLENDTRGASRAFEAITIMQPDLLDGYLNLAKTGLAEGNIDDVYTMLRTCEEISPGNPRVAWVWGNVRQLEGLYDDAIAAFKHVLKHFPDDRQALRRLGRSYYLNQNYQESIKAYESALKLDPEDREAYYHLSLNYRALGNDEEADKMSSAFGYYGIDESAAEISQKYLMESPGDNLMVQSIRIHKLDIR